MSGAVGSLGRVARTNFTMNSMTKPGTSIFRTSFCHAKIRSPVSTFTISGLSSRALIDTIERSSSAEG